MLFVPPPFILAGAAAVTELTFIASATSDDSATVTVPASAAVGDLAVLFDYGTETPLPTKVVPAGYTEATDVTGVQTRLTVSYKVLESGDPGNDITGMDTFPNNKAIVVVRRASGISTITPSTWNGEIANGDPALQTVSASGGTAPLVVFGCDVAGGGTVSFSTASPAFDDEILNPGDDIIVGYKLYDSSPADHDIDADDNGNRNALVSGWLEVA